MSDFQEYPEVVQEVRGALVCIVSFATIFKGAWIKDLLQIGG